MKKVDLSDVEKRLGVYKGGLLGVDRQPVRLFLARLRAKGIVLNEKGQMVCVGCGAVFDRTSAEDCKCEEELRAAIKY